jgi:1-acyl-sn-glycerol-3-phosphate acyltransferase
VSGEHYLQAAGLSPTERRIAGLCEYINERGRPKRMQSQFLREVGRRWVTFCTSNLVNVRGMEHAQHLNPTGGVLLCSNHRSFFDMYVITAMLFHHRVPWLRDLYCPVRSEFFYERWTGLAVNLLMGGGCMYPPIFRDRARAEVNKMSVARITELLHQPGVVIGMHPEGTRGKGPDPYELLRAQPGVGQMALQGDAPVMPVWINGLTNDFPKQIMSNFRTGDGRGQDIDVVFGPPVDLSDLRKEKPRVVLYKKAADRILEHILELGLGLRDSAPQL